jgi:hypothetical protein
MKITLMIILGLGATVGSLKYLTVPYAWIALVWFFFFLYMILSSARHRNRIVLFNIAIVILSLGICEVYLWMKRERPPCELDYPMGIVIRDELFGYASRANTSTSHVKHCGDEKIFDVPYSIDSKGLRVSPPYREEDNKGSILFFGGSYTFGLGVKDTQTMPYLTGIMTQGDYHIYNFAFRGYGPHQMLSALQHGMVESVVEEDPKYVIYQAIIHHVARSAGLVKWDRHGPRFKLHNDRELVYDGHFDDNLIIPYPIRIQMSKSFLYNKSFGRQRAFDMDDIRLFAEIVDESRRIVEMRYPASEFHVILWDDRKHEYFEDIFKALTEKELRLHLFSRIISDYYENQDAYRIHVDDNHPNPHAQGIIAKYVIREIISETE